MKLVCSLMLALAVTVVTLASVRAEDGKEVTLKGTILCSKCELKETPACGNAIRVKEDGKDVVYYLKDKAGKEGYHKTFCQGPVEGSVTGVVVEKDGKKWITPAKDGVKTEK
ncbi:MAG TPA: DUF6370 family protein [Gemmataceae bacterium]|jgi:hypothetical protein|nr:DUF6370 family protein [Gemmataceae bacterium]